MRLELATYGHRQVVLVECDRIGRDGTARGPSASLWGEREGGG
jgi:hypothetical protein